MKRVFGYLMLAFAAAFIICLFAFVTGGPGRWHYTLAGISAVALLWLCIVKGVEWTTP